ncbi:hypothetical protein [Halomarina rubra]|uniref:Uncharacterized protein n=1 Tax=Halomarina rubra TaxID=2071873 RepID=A0ABD6AST7_9EURY|nr:hypothetical protein [Halomarina rubra]
MFRPTRTVVGYALLFAVPVGAGLGVAVETAGRPTGLAVTLGGGVALVLFLVLLAVFSAGSVEGEA